MFKGAMFAAAIIMAGATTASAEITFSGIFTITAANGCENVQKGEHWPSRFHPAFAGQSDHSEGFTIVLDFGAQGYRTEDGNLSDGDFEPVQTGGVGWGGVYILPKNQWARFGNFSFGDPTKKTLTVRGQAQRFLEDPGGLNCVVSFTALYTKDE